MKRLFLAIISIFCAQLFAAEPTLEVEITGFPENYRVYSFQSSSRQVRHTGEMTEAHSVLKFSIPERFIVKNSSGEIDLKASLNKWRLGTPVGNGNPRTKNSIGYYPFKDQNGNIKYIALNYMLDRKDRYNSLKIATNQETPSPRQGGIDEVTHAEEDDDSFDDVEVTTSGMTSSLRPKPRPKNLRTNTTGNHQVQSGSIMQRLSRLYQNPGSLRCGSNNGDAAQCMVCNCYYESRGESQEGQIGVNRTVITRALRNGFPKSACGIIWFKRKGVAAFSWTLESHKNDRRSSSGVKKCVNSTKIALERGAWNYDHFYNPRTSRPPWARRMMNSRKYENIGNHRFLDSGAGYKSSVKRLISRNEYVTIEGVN